MYTPSEVTNIYSHLPIFGYDTHVGQVISTQVTRKIKNKNKVVLFTIKEVLIYRLAHGPYVVPAQRE